LESGLGEWLGEWLGEGRGRFGLIEGLGEWLGEGGGRFGLIEGLGENKLGEGATRVIFVSTVTFDNSVKLLLPTCE
jgi:hypothetical protein